MDKFGMVDHNELIKDTYGTVFKSMKAREHRDCNVTVSWRWDVFRHLSVVLRMVIDIALTDGRVDGL